MTHPRPGPGPKPSGPTHPTPTGPAQPPHALAPGPRPTGPSGPAGPSPSGPVGPTPGGPTHPRTYPLPRLGEIIRDAERYLTQAINTLARQHDPDTAPDLAWNDKPADVRLGQAVHHARTALLHLAELAAEQRMPRAGSAVPVPPAPSNGGHPPFSLPSTPRVPSFASYQPEPLPLRRAVPGLLAADDRAAGGWNWERDS